MDYGLWTMNHGPWCMVRAKVTPAYKRQPLFRGNNETSAPGIPLESAWFQCLFSQRKQDTFFVRCPGKMEEIKSPGAETKAVKVNEYHGQRIELHFFFSLWFWVSTTPYKSKIWDQTKGPLFLLLLARMHLVSQKLEVPPPWYAKTGLNQEVKSTKKLNWIWVKTKQREHPTGVEYKQDVSIFFFFISPKYAASWSVHQCTRRISTRLTLVRQVRKSHQSVMPVHIWMTLSN